jgi:hypothetical protein
VAKLVDATGLGPVGSNAVLVRVQSVAPTLRKLESTGDASPNVLSIQTIDPPQILDGRAKSQVSAIPNSMGDLATIASSNPDLTAFSLFFLFHCDLIVTLCRQVEEKLVS